MTKILQIKLRRGFQSLEYPFAKSYLISRDDLAKENPFLLFGYCVVAPLSTVSRAALLRIKDDALTATAAAYLRTPSPLRFIVPINVSGAGRINSMVPKSWQDDLTYFLKHYSWEQSAARIAKHLMVLPPQETRIYLGPRAEDSMQFCAHCAYITRRFAGGCAPGHPDCFSDAHLIPKEALCRRPRDKKPAE